MSSKNLNKTSVGQKSVILSFLFFTFILFSTSYAFSIFGVSFFEEKKENESTSSIQTFKGLNVKDSTEEEIKEAKEKAFNQVVAEQKTKIRAKPVIKQIQTEVVQGSLFD